MPNQRRKYKRPYKKLKRKYKRKAFGSKGYTLNTKSGQLVYVPQLGGVPSRFRTRLCYAHTLSGLLTSTTADDFNVRLNSLYDFDYDNTLGNIQPSGRDRLAALYSLYQVKSIYIVVDVSAHEATYEVSGTTTVAGGAGLIVRFQRWVSEDSSVSPTAPTYDEMMPGSKHLLISNGGKGRMAVKVNLEKLAGQSGTPFNSGLGAVTGQNPGRPIWGQFLFEGPDCGSTINMRYIATWRVYFDVEFSSPKTAAIDTA